MHFHAIKRSTKVDGTANLPGSYTRPQVDGNDSTAKEELRLPEIVSPISTGDDACDLRAELKKPGCTIPELEAAREEPLGSTKAIIRQPSLEILHHDSAVKVQAPSPHHGSQASSSSSRGSRLTEDSIKSLDAEYSLSRPFNEFITPKSHATVEDDQTDSTHSTSLFLNVAIPMYPTKNLAPFAYHRVLRNRVRDDDLGPGRKYDTKSYTPMFVHDCLVMPGSLATIRGKVRRSPQPDAQKPS